MTPACGGGGKGLTKCWNRIQGQEKSTPSPNTEIGFLPHTGEVWLFPPHLPHPPPVLTSNPHIQGPILGLLDLEGRKKRQRETGIANKPLT